MPGMLQAPINALQISNKFYQKDWNETKQKGYDFKADAIEIKQAKDSRDISSEQPLCRDAWEREKANVNVPADTPGMLQSKINAVQISDNGRLYKKVYNNHKAKISIPVDMVSIKAAKEGQALASDVDYRQYLHH
ncbi:nebulin-related-anchoring protein-like [Canis aureus]